ncbi:MAG TPA: hypothetical protein VLG37_03270 [Candidatus Saccharimonadales bacterium]|nr:hypothetical protein [Candidatus Saccharimonadales bacterium]
MIKGLRLVYRAVTISALGLVLLLAPSLPAQAAYPGDNGVIVVSSDHSSNNRQLYSVTADGSVITQLTEELDGWGEAQDPQYDPQGKKIAFRRGPEFLMLANADGSNEELIAVGEYGAQSPTWSLDSLYIAYINLTSESPAYKLMVKSSLNTDPGEVVYESDAISDLSWSPDGSQIAFSSVDESFNQHIYLLDLTDGSVTQLTNGTGEREPSWSPAGTQITYTGWDGDSEIFVIDSDGTDNIQLTTNTFSDQHPAWSPDGSKIAFEANRVTDVNCTVGSCMELYTMNSDGNNQVRLSNNNSKTYESPDWRPSNVPSYVYRFWSDQKRHHFYTSSFDEAAYVVQNYTDSEWRLEGIAYRAYDAADCGSESPVYRFWSDTYQGHFYTISAAEKDYVLSHYPSNVWRYEGQAFCANTTQVSGTLPLYRFWSDEYKGHFYTTSEVEKQNVINDYPDNIWRYEGVAYFVR